MLQGRVKAGASALLSQNFPKYLCDPGSAAVLEMQTLLQNTTEQPPKQQKDKRIHEFVPPRGRKTEMERDEC